MEHGYTMYGGYMENGDAMEQYMKHGYIYHGRVHGT
jgi:hypothetical protein